MSTASGRNPGWWVLALCSVLLFACGGGGSGGGPGGVVAGGSGVGRVAVLLTDAPTEAFDAVNVTVTEVNLLSDEGQTLVFSDPNGVTRNLLDLRDSAELMFDTVEVPEGCYDKIRLKVSEVELVRYRRDGDGNVVEGPDGNPEFEDPFPVYPKLTGNQKIDLNPRGEFCVAAGETLVLQLDMDAKRSIHVVEKKHGTEYNFRPVVFVKVLDGDRDILGKLVRLSGWVEEAVERDRFTLCGTNVAPLAARMVDDPTCTEVVITRTTSLFDADGSQIMLGADLLLPDEVSPGDFVTAVGRYSVVAAPSRAAASGAMDDLDRRLRRFMAEVVEIGENPQTWGRYAGEVTSVGPLQDCVGTFDVLLDAGQGVTGELNRPVHLVAGTTLFDPEGGDLDCAALEVGRRVEVDAVLFLSDEFSDVLKAAVVVVEPEMVEPETRIDGRLVSVEEDGRLLGILPEGGTSGEAVVCAVVLPNVIPVLEIITTGDEGGIERVDVTLTSAFEGLPVTVFGVWHEDRECFAAGAVVVTGPVPEPGT